MTTATDAAAVAATAVYGLALFINVPSLYSTDPQAAIITVMFSIMYGATMGIYYSILKVKNSKE